MNGWARAPKTHGLGSTHTCTEPDWVEIGTAGGLMLLVEWNCVLGTAAKMSVMDYSGKLANNIFRKTGLHKELNVMYSN